MKNSDTVVILYDAKRDIFFSGKERIALSAEKLLRCIHWRAGQRRVRKSRFGYLTIRFGHALCKITKNAVERLASHYHQNPLHQEAFPLCQRFLSEVA